MADLPQPDAASSIDRVPPEVIAVIRCLDAAGHTALLVGRCVRELLVGEVARDFDVATSAPPASVLALFPTAVPTSPGGRTITLATASGPVDVAHFRWGDRIGEELAHRDFTIHGMALDPLRRELVDPHGGSADLANGSLRAVGDAAARLAEDPLRAVRAGRLVAELGISADAELEAAIPRVAPSLDQVVRARLRQELRALLLAPGAAEGLALLRRTGVEAVLAPGVQPDAGEVVARLPREVDLRLAAWLRGTRAVRILRRLRHPRPHVHRIERILRLHPVETQVPVDRDVRLRRLLRSAGPDLHALLALREAEIAAHGAPAEDVERLERFRAAVERNRRARRGAADTPLALDGRAVMEHLGCSPGPQVGQALRHLAHAVSDAPECNTPDRLRALLDDWAEAPGARGRGVA